MRDGEIYARGAADDKGQVFMHIKAIEAHLKKNGSLPHQHEVLHRGRRGSRQRAPRRVRPRAQAGAHGRRRRDLGLADVRPRHSVDLLRPARPGLLPDRPARHQERPALRIVRRRGGQPRVRAGADPRADEGPQRPHQDSRLLRRRAAAERRRACGVEEAAVQRDEVPQGTGRAAAVRRDGLLDARARVGAADVRGQRPAVRIHRRGRQDRAAGHRDGEGEHAAGARSAPRQGRRSSSRRI